MNRIFQAYHGFAYYAFFLYTTILMTYIGFGYYNNFRNALPWFPRTGLFLLAAIVVGFIFVFIRHAGKLFHESRQLSGRAGLAWIVSFLILFAASGYGFVTSSMLFFEGPIVARDDISEALNNISDLIGVTKSSLPAQEYLTLQSDVNQLKGQLHNEIMNVSQGYCGIGTTATDILDKLAKLLPNIRLITGTDKNHDCKDKKRLSDMEALYDQQIADGLLNSAAYSKGREREREALAASVLPVLDGDITALNTMRATLDGLPSFIGKLDTYHEVLRVLEVANADYTQSFQQISKFLKLASAGYPPRLRTSDLEQISSGVQILNTLVTRLDRLTTYLYVIIALLCDFFAAFAAAAVFREYELRGEIQPAAGVGGSSVQYLWRPEPHPFENKTDDEKDLRA